MPPAADLADEREIEGLFDRHRAERGRLDVLVNNAGVGIGESAAKITTKSLDLQLAVNLRAVILATREGLPMLGKTGTEHGKALHLNVASLAGKSGQPWISVYAATKAAVINFTESVQEEEEAEQQLPASACKRARVAITRSVAGVK